MRFLALLLVMAAGASAGEYVVFASGSRMRVDRHEIAQTGVRLFAGDAWFEVDPTWVLRYEAEESAAPEPAASPVTRLEPYPTSALRTLLRIFPTSKRSTRITWQFSPTGRQRSNMRGAGNPANTLINGTPAAAATC